MKILFAIFYLVLLSSVNAYAAPHGDELYVRHCSSCHGNDGKGGVGVPIALTSFLDSVSNEYLIKTIRHGRPGRIMPAFDFLSDAQVSAIDHEIGRLEKGLKELGVDENTIIIYTSDHGDVLGSNNQEIVRKYIETNRNFNNTIRARSYSTAR